MKRIAVTLIAITCIAGAVQAADVIVEQDPITVPSLAVEDVTAWLATEVLYTIKVVPIVNTNELGEVVSTTSRRVRVIVPETPKEKLKRIAGAAGDSAIRSGLRSWRRQQSAKADDEKPDPIAK